MKEPEKDMQRGRERDAETARAEKISDSLREISTARDWKAQGGRNTHPERQKWKNI